ncbi:MAG: methylated-DNA--protein-cysteine methyltransferase [bacterium (Candidatus Stahlbacteria) CG23_combo_of_CG06-09_8_20_14_all_34_7]|nr:MAG: methylated-DNA--protein-cysteine methyltransferase [bacterium (Candidatus Stahlbacteria) CG23_combo_of_CG06-09_8_20_14_all_34_7]
MNNGYIKTGIGNLEVIEDRGIIRELNFTDKKVKKSNASPIIKRCVKQLEEYFAGKRKIFDLPVKISGTPFQQKVLKEVMKVGYGETASYQDIAKRIGNIKAVRAVGAANRQNKVPLISPCHRIIGKDMSVKGYAGKQRVKTFLITLENPKIKLKTPFSILKRRIVKLHYNV